MGLFHDGLSCLWNDVAVSEDEDRPGTTGIAVFDELPEAERVALVAKGLTDEDASCPDLTVLNVGIAAAIFAHIRCLIEAEIEIQREGIGPESGIPQLVHRHDGCANCPCSRLRSVHEHHALEMPCSGQNRAEGFESLPHR
jgi:hypothetical protein